MLDAEGQQNPSARTRCVEGLIDRMASRHLMVARLDETENSGEPRSEW